MIKVIGAPILLDRSVPHDSIVKAFLDSKRKPLEELEEQVVGITKVLLDGERVGCRSIECNFGNFIADAMVYGRVIEGQSGLYWTDAAIAVMNGGGIRASIDSAPNGTITAADIATVLPFGNPISITTIRGKDLVKSMEHSASLRGTDSDGGFLQVSGLRLVINYNRPKGKRITSMYVLCHDCQVPKYERLERDKHYSVLVPSFILNGGDGHKHFKDPRESQFSQLNLIDRDVLTKYLQEHKIVYPQLDNRIIIVERTRKSCAPLRSQVVLVPIVLSTLAGNIIKN